VPLVVTKCLTVNNPEMAFPNPVIVLVLLLLPEKLGLTDILVLRDRIEYNECEAKRCDTTLLVRFLETIEGLGRV
jgi:hypothetical protein